MLNRLIFERIETRVLVGTIVFVATMVLVGWIAINEPARMASFERTFLGRSIERGAELFAANCSTCHGTDGRGIAGVAPALNNPHLFGYDYLAASNNDILSMQRQIGDLRSEREALLESDEDDGGRIAEIDAEIAALEESITALEEQRSAAIAQLQPAMDNGYFPRLSSFSGMQLSFYLANDASRLNQAGWASDLRSFVYSTLVHGRPDTAPMWSGNQMVAWHQSGGGTLREDQVNDLVNYILNWDKGGQWTLEDLLSVNQFGRLKADAALAAAPEDFVSVADEFGDDLRAITAAVAELDGDAARGADLYNNAQPASSGARLGCSGCHAAGIVAPLTETTWDSVVNQRLALPQFASYTAEQYVVESILVPGAYIVDGYTNSMPAQFAGSLNVQDLADIVAYLQSYASDAP